MCNLKKDGKHVTLIVNSRSLPDFPGAITVYMQMTLNPFTAGNRVLKGNNPFIAGNRVLKGSRRLAKMNTRTNKARQPFEKQ